MLYEWGQHVEIAKRAGLKMEEIERVKQGAGCEGLTEAGGLLVKAADELHHDQFVSEATWTASASIFRRSSACTSSSPAPSTRWCSMILNSFGVQLDPGLPLDPEFEEGLLKERPGLFDAWRLIFSKPQRIRRPSSVPSRHPQRGPAAPSRSSATSATARQCPRRS